MTETKEAREREIIELEGYELDAAIATKIMGLPVMTLADAPCPYCGSEMRFCGERSRCSVCSEWRYSPYKEYSGDIESAWEVVEKFDFFRLTKSGGLSGVVWIAKVEDSEIFHPSAPTAICRVALLARLGLG